MRVSFEYVKEHLEELLDLVDKGELVEFEAPSGERYRFVLASSPDK